MLEKRIIFFVIIISLVSCCLSFPAPEIASKTSQSAVKQVTNPIARMGHRMVYNSMNQIMILFGGTKGAVGLELDDTWGYNTSNNSWFALNPAIKPSPRSMPSMVYNPVTQKIILFGGADDTSPLDDTWIYDYTTNNWTQVFPAVSPPIRHSHTMIYDSRNQKMILFGGYGANHELLNDTWAYDYATNTWIELKPVSSPSARYGHTMAYDPVNEKVILFGGNNWVEGLKNDTWVYDYGSNNWTELSPQTRPSPRKWSEMVYIPTNQNFLLFGGGGGIYLGDTWIYDPSTNDWSNVTASIAPTGRCLTALAYDSLNQKVILFGGRCEPGTVDDTWTYNPLDTTWLFMTPPSSSTIPSSLSSTVSTSSSTISSAPTDFLTFESFLLTLGFVGLVFRHRRKTHSR